jgi:hypothetical protein
MVVQWLFNGCSMVVQWLFNRLCRFNFLTLDDKSRDRASVAI